MKLRNSILFGKCKSSTMLLLVSLFFVLTICGQIIYQTKIVSADVNYETIAEEIITEPIFENDSSTTEEFFSGDITDYIPLWYFIDEGENQYVGDDYGYFISTKLLPPAGSLSGEQFESKVFLFQIQRENDEDNNTYSFNIIPIIDEVYYYTSDSEIKTYEEKHNGSERTTYLAMSNINYFANVINTHEGDTSYSYNRYQDDGYFIEGAYTQGNYMILEESDLIYEVAEYTLSYLWDGLLTEFIPGYSVISAINGFFAETTDWQRMHAVNDVPHIHYGDYNYQSENGFIRNVLIRDTDGQARYLKAGENQNIEFVIEYDNKSREDVEAQIRNMLSFDIYEFKKEGEINLGEEKLNTTNETDEVVSNFNDIELTAQESKYHIENDTLKYHDAYSNVFINNNCTQTLIFQPEVDGYYSIVSNGDIEFLYDSQVLNLNNLYLNKNKVYTINISGINNNLAYVRLELDQDISVISNKLIEGVNIKQIEIESPQIKRFKVSNTNVQSVFFIFDENGQLIHSVPSLNNEIEVSYLFGQGSYSLVVFNGSGYTMSNSGFEEKDAEVVTVNAPFGKTVPEDTKYYVNIDFDYTALYEFTGSENIKIYDTSSETLLSIQNNMLLSTEITYYLIIEGGGETISLSLSYAASDVYNGVNVTEGLNVNNIYRFECNYTWDYKISGLTDYIVLDEETYSQILPDEDVIRLNSSKAYIIVDEEKALQAKNVKIEIVNSQIDVGVKAQVNSDTVYKITATFSGIAEINPENVERTIYDSDLNVVTSANVVKDESYYIKVNGSEVDIIVLPHKQTLEQGVEAYISSSKTIEINNDQICEKRITVKKGECDELQYQIKIYNQDYDVVYSNDVNNSNNFNDIVLSLNAGTYYISMLELSGNCVLVFDDKVKQVNFNSQITVETIDGRCLDYRINISKTAAYNFACENCEVSIQGEIIESDGDITLSPGQYDFQIIGKTESLTTSIVVISINADIIGLVSDSEAMEANTIYEIFGFESGSYSFVAVGTYYIYDENLNLLGSNGEVVFISGKKYYLEKQNGGTANYVFANSHKVLSTDGFAINLSNDESCYFAFENSNQNYVAIFCSDSNVEINVYNNFGQTGQSIIASGHGLVFAYSEDLVRYVSFSGDADVNNAIVKIVDPTAVVQNEIAWHQAMEIGQSYFKFIAPVNGEYMISCAQETCGNVEVYDSYGIKLSGSIIDFTAGNSYIIKHTGMASHIVNVTMLLNELNANAKYNFYIGNSVKYYAINVEKTTKLFSPTHNVKIYETIDLDEPSLDIAMNSVGCVEPFSTSRKIICVNGEQGANFTLYLWQDLDECAVMTYSINDDAKQNAENGVNYYDVREELTFYLSSEYDDISEFSNAHYEYDPGIVTGCQERYVSISVSVMVNGIAVDCLTRSINIKLIGAPNSIVFSIDNKKTRYNGYESFNYSVKTYSGTYLVEGYDYTIEQVDGNNELNIDLGNKRVTFNTARNLYGKNFTIEATCGDCSDSENINVDVDQTISYRYEYKENVEINSDNEVIMNIPSGTKALRIDLRDLNQYGYLGLVSWIFNIPSHVKYVEFVGDGSTIQFVTINLLGETILKFNNIKFMGLTNTVRGSTNATIMVEGLVVLWGSICLISQVPYACVEVDGTLNLILFEGASLNIKGGVGQSGEVGCQGSTGIKGADGGPFKDGATGGQGGKGGQGGEGGQGEVGIRADKIFATSCSNTRLRIEGGAGGQGGQGGKGGTGGRGGADTSALFCNPGAGGRGGAGGQGGQGGLGGFALECNMHDIPSNCLVNHNAERGDVGDGGNGGDGGAGGDGGDSGSDGTPGGKGETGEIGDNKEFSTFGYSDWANEIFGA